MAADESVLAEAERILALPLTQARRVFADHVARAYLLNAPTQLHDFRLALDFNARLATQIRLRARERGLKTIWETFA